MVPAVESTDTLHHPFYMHRSSHHLSHIILHPGWWNLRECSFLYHHSFWSLPYLHISIGWKLYLECDHSTFHLSSNRFTYGKLKWFFELPVSNDSHYINCEHLVQHFLFPLVLDGNTLCSLFQLLRVLDRMHGTDYHRKHVYCRCSTPTVLCMFENCVYVNCVMNI